MNIQFNGRGFNCERAAMKTETEFVGLHLRTGFLPELKLANRFLLLKEAYALCLKALGKETPVETSEEAMEQPEINKEHPIQTEEDLDNVFKDIVKEATGLKPTTKAKRNRK